MVAPIRLLQKMSFGRPYNFLVRLNLFVLIGVVMIIVFAVVATRFRFYFVKTSPKM